MQKVLLTLVSTALLSAAGILLSHLVMPSVTDGICSGVWGPIAWHCHARQIVVVAIFALLPSVLFKRKYLVSIVVVVVYLIHTLFIGTYEAGGVMHYPYYQGGFYIPDFHGVWVGLYTVSITLIANMLARKYSMKYRGVGL